MPKTPAVGQMMKMMGHGRKMKTSTRTDSYINTLVLKNRKMSSKELVKQLEEATGVRVCQQTIKKQIKMNVGCMGGLLSRNLSSARRIGIKD